ncbi:MAG: hypothetical protein ACE5K7_05835, partial [Phycisphaerae bacterium]
MARAETVTLQQGLKGYTGCTTRTLVDGQPLRQADDGLFHLRGAKRQLQVRFELPKALAAKKLARARLWLFLPQARNANTYTEIFCHEVTTAGRQPAIDEWTDYDNGRRPGAVDSVELFAPGGRGWKHFPYLPLGVPKGGKWIAFNVTPLAERWIEEPTCNHGVML